MPNIKSAKKRVTVTQTKTLKNNMQKSALKTAVKKAKQALSDGIDTSKEILQNTIKLIDKAVAGGMLHKNNAARKKSQLQKDFNKTTIKTAATPTSTKTTKAAATKATKTAATKTATAKTTKK